MLLDNRRLLPLIALQQGVLVLALWPQLQLWVVAVGAITLGVRAMMLWQEWRSPPLAYWHCWPSRGFCCWPGNGGR